MTKSRFKFLGFFLAGALVWSTAFGQRDGRPRRLDQPDTIALPGGGRVEFHTFESAALGREMRYSVLIPPSYDKSPDRKFPTVYFLHGMFNDDSSWCVDRYGNLPPLIEKLMLDGKVPEFLMVHPSGEDSFYTDSADGTRNFERYISSDVVAEVQRRFRARADRAGRSIGGTSMGGYGALKIAFKNPDRFGSVAAGSPIVLLGDDPTSSLAAPDTRPGQFFSGVFAKVYGNPLDLNHWRANSLEHLARTAQLGDLKILLLYGTADRYNGLIPMEKGVRELASILESRKAAARLEILENEEHGWNLIVNHIEEVLQALTQTF